MFIELSLKLLLNRSNFIEVSQKHFEPLTHTQPTNSQVYLLDPDLFWKFLPSQKYSLKEIDSQYNFILKINSNGFRGEELGSGIEKCDFRILSLGDSCTVGWYFKDTYTSILKDLIANKYPSLSIAAINAGVDGYTSYQGLKFISKNINFFKPDLLLVHFGHNDWSDAILNIEDKRQNYFNFLYLKSKKILKKSFLFLTIYEAVYKLKKDIIRVPMQPAVRVSLKDFRNNLLKIYLLARSLDIPLIFINSSVSASKSNTRTDLNLEYIQNLSKKYAKCMEEITNSYKGVYLVNVISLANAMGEIKFYADSKNGDIWHPSRFGHKKIAEEVFDIITKNKIIERKSF